MAYSSLCGLERAPSGGRPVVACLTSKLVFLGRHFLLTRCHKLLVLPYSYGIDAKGEARLIKGLPRIISIFDATVALP